MFDAEEPDRQNAMLTRDQRQGLLTNWTGRSRQERSYHQRALVERVQNTLKDFWLLCDHLSETRRSEIFDAEPGTDEYWSIQNDITRAIEFLYTGVGGERGFRGPLKHGVSEGEVALGNIENTLEADPRFTVDPYLQPDRSAAVDAIERGEWDRLRSPDLFSFVRMARNQGAIDFEDIRDYLNGNVEEFNLTYISQSEQIQITGKTAERLGAFQQSGESVDETLNRLLDAHEE